MKALVINKNYPSIDDVHFDLVEKPKPSPNSEQDCLIKVSAVGINPSDALATIGYFTHAQVPRTPGRDFAGVVIAGPKPLIGKSVWGTGGEAGISYDGNLAEYIMLPKSAIAVIPKGLDCLSASMQTLPYVTAYISLAERAAINKNDTTLVVGALGQVGQAAMSIAHWQGNKAIALVLGKESVAKAKARGWIAYDTTEKGFIKKLLREHGEVNVILNSVGNILWDDYLAALAPFGRIVTIGARPGTREVNVDLFRLYRANQTLAGVNTVSFNFADNAKFLNELKPGFESGALQPLAVDQNAIYPLADAESAFRQVMRKGNKSRVAIGLA